MRLTWRQRLALQTALPWVVFGLLIVSILLIRGTRLFVRPLRGYAEATLTAVAAPEAGRLVALLVHPGQEVAKGDILARLDDSALQADLRFHAAEEQRLQAEMRSTSAASERVAFLDARRVTDQIDSARVQLAQGRVDLLQAQAREAALRTECERLRSLVASHLATSETLSRLELEHAEVLLKTQTLPLSLEALEAQLRNAQVQLASSQDNAAVTSPLAQELASLKEKRAWLEARLEALTLRAPDSGTVAQVLTRVGEGLIEGESVLSLVSTLPSRVVACLEEGNPTRVALGARASMSLASGDRRPFSGVVLALSPVVELLPERCRPVPALPTFGQTILISLSEPHFLMAGQSVLVIMEGEAVTGHASPERTESPPSAGSALAEEVSPGSQRMEAQIHPLKLPSDRSLRVEPSGLLWRPNEERYLLVSDDTGQVRGIRHQPVLFSLTRDGIISDTPLRVEGVAELDDLEAITAMPDGRILVLSSQSFNREGKRSSARTALLELAEKQDHLRVTGEVHLAELLEARGEAFLRSLGLPGHTQDLNIEGMCFSDGALYLGLKGPLTERGEALVWKLEAVDTLFRSGHLAEGSLSLFATMSLPVRVDQEATEGGIADLLFVPDGSLWVASTPSRQRSGIPTGGLYRVDKPQPGVLRPEVVRTFPGLKPEGLSVSGDTVMVVFDAGSLEPRYVEVPWRS